MGASLTAMSRAASDTSPFRPSRARTAVATVVAILALACWSGSSAAQTAPPPPPDDEGAIDEYVEEIPTGGGGVAPGGGANETTPLPPSINAELQTEAGGDADVLRKIASASDAGAPQASAASELRARLRASAASERESAVAGALEDAGSPLSAAASAVTGSSGGRLLGLLVVLVLITGTALGFAVYRRGNRPT